MSDQNYDIAYDQESQVLSLGQSIAKSVDSEISDNIVIDYDKEGRVVRINLYNFKFSDFKNNLKTFRDFTRASRVAISVK